jgi:hypothetical protein
MTMQGYWAVAQTVSKMEHIVRREIEKTNHGAFLPTCARHQQIDGRQHSKERPVIGGYVFFYTTGRDFAGIPDIHGVYNVLTCAPDMDTPDRPPSAARVQPKEMVRLMVDHASGEHDETLPPRYTKYYRPQPSSSSRRKSRKPRASKRLRTLHTP